MIKITASKIWMNINGIRTASGFTLYNCPIIKAIAKSLKYLNIKYHNVYFRILIPANFYRKVVDCVILA